MSHGCLSALLRKAYSKGFGKVSRHYLFFYSAGARDKWSQSPIKETKIKAIQYSVHKKAWWESYVSLKCQATINDKETLSLTYEPTITRRLAIAFPISIFHKTRPPSATRCPHHWQSVIATHCHLEPTTARCSHDMMPSATQRTACSNFQFPKNFLICRRARRQRSQSPVLGTSRIDKHFELYKKLKTKRKTKEFPISLSSDGAYEQIPFDSPISKKERGKLYNPATQERPSHMIVKTCKWRVSIELRQICTCRRALNCKQPQW